MMRVVMTVMVFGLAVSYAHGDTIWFKDGTSLDGKVSQPNVNVYVLEVKNGSMHFQASTVARWEENDKMGEYNMYVMSPRQRAHEEQRQEMTGLTPEEIEELFQIMEPLGSDDPADVDRAKQALLAKHGEKDIFKFLKAAMRDMTYKYRPAVMDVMSEIDPERARPVLAEQARDPFTENRAKALELLGTVGTKDDLETIARGVVDQDPVVGMAAAESLAKLGDRAATPALLEGLRSTDRRVQNTSQEALSRLWANAGAPADSSSPADWQAFWQSQSSSVDKPVRVANLSPLVSSEELDQGLQYDE